ncbi:uncharacterized protein LOC111862740 isoform X2 [Cryptotermes secundus]|uniref:uncharacterized protein LOC111862740 isoform X2 n=1 Tax=Cryptotermes secundus TaxID=105785 RepID=UPI000CD7C5D9|nr:uncharacterized protein LOC111862740 isoform X2 [Cryptotermes secundus]
MASSSCIRKSLLSLNNGGSSPSIVLPTKERSNSNTSCKTTSALALATSSMVDFWNRVSQQMAYIDGSTRSPSLIDGGSTRSSLRNDCTRDSMLVAMDTAALLARPSAENRSSSLLDEQNMRSGSVLELEYDHSASIPDDENSHSVSLLDGVNDELSASVLDDVIVPLPPSDLAHTDVGRPLKQRHPTEITSPVSYKSCSGSRHTATTCSLEASPPQSVRSSALHHQLAHKSFQRLVSVSSEDEERCRNKPWYRRASPVDKQQKRAALLDSNDNDGDQSAIWHHVFTEVASKYVKNTEQPGTRYKNYFNDDDDCCNDDGDYTKDGMELGLLQPTPDISGKARPPGCAAAIPNSATSTSVVMETASMGGGRMTTRTRLHKYQQQFSFCAGDRRLSQPFDMYGCVTKKASSWEESEAVQRRRSVMMAVSGMEYLHQTHLPTANCTLATSCPGTAGLLMLHPTSSELKLLDKRDLRYYFQHPYPRLFVTYFVIFCNFLLFAEDPISHSHTESDIPMVGNVFSFVLTKYPPEWRWSLIKVLMWLLAMLCGMVLGKLLIHGYVCGKLLRLKMFRDDQGSWMTMFLTVIVSLYVFSHAYNLLLFLWYDNPLYQINSHMGATNASVMKAAACGTWLGDLITALMVTDMMLQDNLYPQWASCFRKIWRRSNIPRILIFWVGSVVATSVVVTLIVSDWISWDRLNRDFVATTELSRAFLASFILVMDLLIVMQDWDFPHFTTTLHVNLPGFSVATLKWKYAEVDITGKWFNYGIIVLVMLLDLNMWKNQIFYNPKDFGPDDKIRTVNDRDLLVTRNTSYWTWESRTHINPDTGLPHYEEDMQMNSRFMNYPLSVKWTAFIPSVIGLVLFVSLVSLYGRFPAHQTHGQTRDLSPCRGAQGRDPNSR